LRPKLLQRDDQLYITQGNCVKTLELSKLTALVLGCVLLVTLGACSKQKPPTINDELQLAIGLGNVKKVSSLIDQGPMLIQRR